ncbi:PREDICTED: very-long-chain 3-oxoacyl-CoA reductase-like [Priapulus caudatus]|uniref:Very-long-chain 3-oxoacyl-CoA reductase-like n=1 Tax=Priapulus caudatus TaxID=37621 RepID=A0ABM1EK91_PRICU|nr:PREDICTED: very-long-chain 3-oxoacyl-CoA reductase-like [Priapulus caudatus]
MGSWAVVTGATDGIGKVYAEKLAKIGLNVVLVSRSPEKLKAVENEISAGSNVQVKTVAVDFGDGNHIYERIEKELQGLEIGVLVNNVGMAYKNPSYFLEVDREDHAKIINVNIFSCVMMTNIILPQMIDRKKGVIVNISSASAMMPSPLLATYSASKVFVDYFSQALEREYKDKGIIIQSVLPFFVKTNMSKIKKSSFFMPTPATYVDQAIGTIGVASKTFGCLAHALQGFVVQGLAPDWLVDYVSLKMHIDIRKRALRKKQK